MNAFLHAHPWLLFFVALFVVFTLNAAVMWALCRAAALGDRLAPEPCMAGSGTPGPSELPLPASADEFMRSWDIEAELAGMDWWPR